MLTISDMLGAIVAQDVLGAVLEITPLGGALFVRRQPTLHLVLEGAGLLEIPSLNEAVAFAEGDLLLLPHGALHRIRAGRRARAETAKSARPRDQTPARDHLPVFRFGSGEPALRLTSAIFDLRHARANALVRLLPNILRGPLLSTAMVPARERLELALRGPGGSVLIDRLVNFLLSDMIARHMVQSDAASRLGANIAGAAPAEKIIGLINAELDRNWTLPQLAQRAGMSRTIFSARFADYVGEPPMTYLTHARMMRTAEMLRSTNLGIGAIAAAVGYRSAAALSRAFQKSFGIAPGRYRRKSWVEGNTAE
jgi:AraC-like DNA-binding protein